MANPRPQASSKLLQENDRIIVTASIEAALAVGQAYARPAGVEHNIVNPGSEAFAFVEIEIK